jgi:ribosome-binding protein aMBF1 (putative translation factor)
MRSKILKEILDETPEETRIFVKKYGDIVVRVHQILKEKGLTQKELADQMGKRQSEISKWLKGEHNFTLRSLAKLEAELGTEIIYIAKKDSFHVQRGGNIKQVTPKPEPISTKVQFHQTNKPSTSAPEPLAA